MSLDDETMWKRADKHGRVSVAQRHRTCDACGRDFLSGFIEVERGYIVGAKCHACVVEPRIKDA